MMPLVSGVLRAIFFEVGQTMHDPLTRREFLSCASLSALSAACGSGFINGLAARAASLIRRMGGARLKTSLNVYSFSKPLFDQIQGRGKGMSLLEVLDYCAEQNFDAIDPTGYFFPGYPKVPSDTYLNEFKRRAFELGLDISGTGVRNNFASPDPKARQADVELVKNWIECAARLGASVIRVFSGPQPEGYSFDQVAAWMVDDLARCVEHGKKYGVLVGVQNHGDTLKTADQVLEIIKRVDSEWFGAIVDTGYFLTPDPYDDIARVLPFAVNWQIKERLAGKGSPRRTDLRKLVRLIRNGGYRGYLPIETLATPGEPYDPRARVAELLGELRKALGEET